MLENYLGVDVFRKGLNLYLERFQYSNAKTVGMTSMSTANRTISKGQ